MNILKEYAIWLDRNIISLLKSGKRPTLDQYVKDKYGEGVYKRLLDGFGGDDSI